MTGKIIDREKYGGISEKPPIYPGHNIPEYYLTRAFRAGWEATALDSGAVFPEVDLGEGEWCDYDEKEVRSYL